MDKRPSPNDLRTRAERLLGRRPIRSRPVRRGYTPAERRLLAFEDGSSVFAKLATTEEMAGELRLEHRVHREVEGAFLPRLLGWEDGPRPLLLLEDLSAAHWPPPWSAAQVERTRLALRDLHSRPAPAGGPELGAEGGDFVAWERFGADPAPFLSLGLCSRRWLEAALPSLIAAERAVRLGGDHLVHGDLYSDNLCIAERGAPIIDWGNARRGDGRFDLATFLIGARAESAPVPQPLVPDAPEFAAMLTGLIAYSAMHPPPTGSEIRSLRRRDLRRGALPWAVHALDPPSPDRPEPPSNAGSPLSH